MTECLSNVLNVLYRNENCHEKVNSFPTRVKRSCIHRYAWYTILHHFRHLWVTVPVIARASMLHTHTWQLNAAERGEPADANERCICHKASFMTGQMLSVRVQSLATTLTPSSIRNQQVQKFTTRPKLSERQMTCRGCQSLLGPTTEGQILEHSLSHSASLWLSPLAVCLYLSL